MQAGSAYSAFTSCKLSKIVIKIHVVRIKKLTGKDSKIKINDRKLMITIQKAY
jgi:hypothetical protein